MRINAAFAALIIDRCSSVQNLGVATPAPTLALVVTSLAAGLAVYFIFQAGSRN